jgi:leucyl-tRNA synthetase
LLFEAPPEKEIEWTDARLEGPHRFLLRMWRLVDAEAERLRSVPAVEGKENWNEAEAALRRKTHQTIRRVTRDIEDRLHLNTAISAIMELTNEIYRVIEPRPERPESWKVIRHAVETMVLLASPFAPHVAEEMWEMLGHRGGLGKQAWPSYDPAIAAEEMITLVLQVNGKIRNRISVPADLDEEEARERALADEKIAAALAGSKVERVVVVPGRLVNVVAGR